MRVTVEQEDGTKQVYQDVTDCYIALRQFKPMQSKDADFALLPETRSYSWGGNIREIVKEVRQSLLELEDFLKEQRNGNSAFGRDRGVAEHSGEHPIRLVPRNES